jgi:hypothetical protein
MNPFQHIVNMKNLNKDNVKNMNKINIDMTKLVVDDIRVNMDVTERSVALSCYKPFGIKTCRVIFEKQAENLRYANKLIMGTLYQFGQFFRTEEPEQK